MKLTSVYKQLLIAFITHIGVIAYAQSSEDEGIVLHGITSKIILQNVNKSLSDTNNSSLIKGETYLVNIKEHSATPSSKQFTICIDYNGNENTYDKGENVLSVLTSRSFASGKFTIPENINTGTFKLRIISFNPASDMKIPITPNMPRSGQVIEEYKINITDGMSRSTNSLVNTADRSLVAIYPNPVQGVIHINTKRQEPIIYKLFSASGQVMLSGTTNDKTVNVKSIPTGAYILEVTQGESITTHKLIKQ
ncbi:T9SS type A sorting domain-containing protein [Chryseobacterium sp. NRRL B-14859]|uniref:T9SS type A sorting domain-containing protein n=1 Tax=Chryseobacterium sp. NRRL B-14859 TaxID=1562763 RepID=UPI003399D506